MSTRRSGSTRDAPAQLVIRATADERARWGAALVEDESLSEYVRQACDQLAERRAGGGYLRQAAALVALREAADRAAEEIERCVDETADAIGLAPTDG